MNILLLGSGGREHALAWKLAQSPKLDKLYIAPGNAGTQQSGTNIPLNPNDFKAIRDWILQNPVQMVVVGPEEPLVLGIRDFFQSDNLLKDIQVIGPGKDGAMLEGSKDFAKHFMHRYHIPTARSKTFDISSLEAGIEFIRSLKPPYVLKADGLAAGKGVIIAGHVDTAIGEFNSMLRNKKFGKASEKVIVEEYLNGIELSVFILTDGKHYLILPEAKDYKKIGEGDTGPNTGGMGSISPVPFATRDFLSKIEKQIIQPTITGLQQEEIDYRGFIFFGLMNCNGNPYVIEYNCRMGDPECESVIPRIQNDLIDLFVALKYQSLNQHKLHTDPRTYATVFLVSEGYPGEYKKGEVITQTNRCKGSMLFHAGTSFDPESKNIITSGGRVIAVTSPGNNINEALQTCNRNASVIKFKGKYYRHDIGFDLC